MTETVAILGASTNPERYSHMAQLALADHGHTPIPINPGHKEIGGIPCYASLDSCREQIDTITVYTKPAILINLIPQIISSKAKRVILNPGTEDAALIEQLEQAGIQVQLACTLVLLSTNQFCQV